MGRFKKLKQRVEVLEFKQLGCNIEHEFNYTACNYSKLCIEYHFNIKFLNADESKVVKCTLTTLSEYACLKTNGDYIEVRDGKNLINVYKINRVKGKLDEVDLELYKKAYYLEKLSLGEFISKVVRGE